MSKTQGRLVVLAMAFVLVAQSAALAADPLRITDPVQVTEGDLVPTRTYSSPYLAIDPQNPLNAVAAFVDMRARRCGLLRSTDGGQSWVQLDSAPSLPSYPFCFHTSGGVTQTPLAFGKNGTLYYALSAWDTQDGGNRRNISVALARSDDLGDTWETTLVRDTRGFEDDQAENNRPVSGVAVDTSGDTDVVYVAWRANFPTADPSLPSEPMVAVSTDGGRTFSEPINATADFFEDESVIADELEFVEENAEEPPDEPITSQNFGGGNPQLAVADNGTVYVLWQQATTGLEPRPDVPMYLSKSTDRGATWTISEVSPPSNWYGGPVLRWSPEGGPEGSLHVVYENKIDQTQGDRDIHHRRSTDGGSTWSDDTILHDDDPEQLIGQFIPNLSVAPNGRLDAVWWDFRHDPGTYQNDVYYTYSTDNGVTWSQNIRVTDRSINRKIGPWSNNFDMRQPPGVASAEDYALFGWDDTRNGDPVGQAQDIFSSAVQFSVLEGGTPNALKYVLAGVIGLVVVGIVLLILAMATRRRAGPPPETERVREREPEPSGVS
ncbi:MAG TPA: sialidase family protein [Egibacteraceae bacterium]|nr:sialidase family protein [Egibacteraceae bacterium]